MLCLKETLLPAAMWQYVAHVQDGFHWYPGFFVHLWENLLGGVAITEKIAQLFALSS